MCCFCHQMLVWERKEGGRGKEREGERGGGGGRGGRRGRGGRGGRERGKRGGRGGGRRRGGERGGGRKGGEGWGAIDIVFFPSARREKLLLHYRHTILHSPWSAHDHRKL